MRIGDQYVGLGLGDASGEILAIKDYMRRKFSYAKTLADTPVFDAQMVTAVAEMQRRYNADGKLPTDKYTPGILNAETKYVMGYLKRPIPPDTRPMLFTVCGTGVPWWIGPDADTARAVEDLYKWQPIGYRAAPVPMGPSIVEGRAELNNQFTIWRNEIETKRKGIVLAGYSQGAIVTSETWEYDIKPPTGALHWALPYMRKAVTWGNPMREHGKAWPDPGAALADAVSSGITDPTMVDTPEWWRNYAHHGDLYAEVDPGESAEDKRAIWQIIRGTKVFSGPDSLLRQFLELTESPIPGAIGAFQAMWDAGMFFAHNAGPHTDYNIGPAITYLRS